MGDARFAAGTLAHMPCALEAFPCRQRCVSRRDRDGPGDEGEENRGATDNSPKAGKRHREIFRLGSF